MRFDLKNFQLRRRKNQIWQGIVRKAQQDGDESLSPLQYTFANRKTAYSWAAVAASIMVVFTLTYLLWPTPKQHYVAEKELSEIFRDTGSYSKLVLSTGDTIALDNTQSLAEIAFLQNEQNVLDFRQMQGEGLESMWQFVETGRGKQTHFILPDGSSVWLNAASTITFPASFGPKERRVSIRGEVYFEVAHDQQRPFIVQSEAQDVKVLGTAFNVREYTDDLDKSVTLLEGAIELHAGGEPLRLFPGEQFLQNDASKPTVRRLRDPATVIAWKNDIFYFEDADALEIVKELERWYPVKIHLQEYAKDKKISGRIRRSDSLHEVAEMLRFFDIQILVEKI